MTRVWFPRLLAPIAAVLAAIVDLLIGLLLLVPVMAASGVAPPLQVLTLPLWLLGAVLVAIGRRVLARRRQRALSRRPLRAHLPAAALALRQPGGLPDLAGRRAVALPLLAQPGRRRDRWVALGLAGSAGSGAGAGRLRSPRCLLLLFGGAWYFRRVERNFADRI